MFCGVELGTEKIFLHAEWSIKTPLYINNKEKAFIKTGKTVLKKLYVMVGKDDWSDDEAEVPSGVTGNMLTAADFLDDCKRQHIYNFAPGEGNL